MRLRVSLVSLGSRQTVRLLKEEVIGTAWAQEEGCREQLPTEEGHGLAQASLWGGATPLLRSSQAFPHSLPVPPAHSKQKPEGTDVLDVVHEGQPWAQSRAEDLQGEE